MQFIKYVRRYRYVTLVLLMCVVASTVGALGSGRKLFMPFVTSSATEDEGSTDLRVDNIALWDLDERLQQFGIYNASTRYAIYQWEVNRRNGGGAQPDGGGYPSPQATPDWFTFRQWTGCQLGQGCFVGWKGSGHMQSHFRTADMGLFNPWSFGVFCPINFICTVITKKGPTNNTPQPRHLLEYELRASHAPVEWINQMCSF